MTAVDDPDGILVAAGDPMVMGYVAVARHAQALAAQIADTERDLARKERAIAQHAKRGSTAHATRQRAAELRERLALLRADHDAAANVARMRLSVLAARSPAVAARWEQALADQPFETP